MAASCILFQNEAQTLVVLDIPRSIEEAQVPSGTAPSRRLYSTAGPAAPFPVPEPKDADARAMALSPAALLPELMTRHAVTSALDELRASYAGPYCLPRVECAERACDETDAVAMSDDAVTREPYLLPPAATPLHGSIAALRTQFLARTSPGQFRLVVLDPPWPNQSAARRARGRDRARGSYATAATVAGAAALLGQIPVRARLAPGGVVGVWVTNAPQLHELLVADGGVLAAWGLQAVAQWTWVKVTAAGEPVFDVEGAYRKPWERLVLARARGEHGRVADKVLVAVPDMHSRKPNLRPLFDELWGPGYCALEVFARNLTAGWWSWGDQVLRFQQSKYWAEER